MKGTIVKYPKTGRLSINGTLSTQNFVTLRDEDILNFNLKEGDVVEYDGVPYETVHVIAKISHRDKIFINGYNYWMDTTSKPHVMFYDTEIAQYGISIEDPNWTKDELRQIKEILSKKQ